jgi:NADH dehydrogenase
VGPDGRREETTYDYLVLALGSVTRLPPVPGLREYAYGVKSIGDALALHDRALEMLELADAATNPELRRALLHFVIVGGNFTGVEVAGELSTFVRQAARRYRHLDPADVTVTLVELTERVLRQLGERLSDRAAEQLRRCGITLRLNESVRCIEPHGVELVSGQALAARTVIWCAGIAPSPLLARLPFPKDSRGYVLTGRDLRCPGFANVWAIGDAAVNPGPDGEAYPATAQHAVQQARHAGNDLLRVLAGKPTRPCSIASRGSLAALGCRTGVALVLGVPVSGFAAWWLYRTVYLLKMPGLARKVRIALDWTLDLLFRREHVSLNVTRRPPSP